MAVLYLCSIDKGGLRPCSLLGSRSSVVSALAAQASDLSSIPSDSLPFLKVEESQLLRISNV